MIINEGTDWFPPQVCYGTIKEIYVASLQFVTSLSGG